LVGNKKLDGPFEEKEAAMSDAKIGRRNPRRALTVRSTRTGCSIQEKPGLRRERRQLRNLGQLKSGRANPTFLAV